MQEFGNDSPLRTRAKDAYELAPEEAPTVKIRAARALPEAAESSGRHPVATPTQGDAGT
jgi:hypothetical protein